MHKVAITGVGCVSPLGLTAPATRQALRDGVCGIAPTTLIPPEKLHIRIAAEVKGFDPAAHFDDRKLSLLDRFSQFTLVAANEAVAESGLDLSGDLGRATA